MNNAYLTYVPKESHPHLVEIVKWFDGVILVSKPRKTKLGDYRSKNRQGRAQITVNNDLNPYAFLITLVHELAHHRVFEKFKNSVRPHGQEWKSEFKFLLSPLISESVFPLEIKKALERFIKNPDASSCTDEFLYKKLKLYDAQTEPGTYVNDLYEGDLFSYSTKGIFKVIEKKRKRTLCYSLSDKRKYLFQPTVKIQII